MKNILCILFFVPAVKQLLTCKFLTCSPKITTTVNPVIHKILVSVLKCSIYHFAFCKQVLTFCVQLKAYHKTETSLTQILPSCFTEWVPGNAIPTLKAAVYAQWHQDPSLPKSNTVLYANPSPRRKGGDKSRGYSISLDGRCKNNHNTTK